ncbi:hypothetical protein R3W88_008326 [Solanum pinnatisectum]|uniref:Uncharacterized protein n=1 Tax=Solanum pinnatisectum TaxID=50273 RepID=A0AAV9M7M9_9SOLN|nr:hypothetical protein R3W88_008326 [Solanum pinnatisectum]
MGACASKPKVLEGTAPHVVGEDILNNNKQEGIAGDDVPNKPHSLSNLFKEGKGSEQVIEETSTEAQLEVLPKTEETPEAFHENKAEDVIESKIEKRVEIKSEKEEEEVIKSETETTTPAQKEEVIKSESETEITTPAQKEEVIKSETETPTPETEISSEKKVEETVDIPVQEVAQVEKKSSEEEKSEAPVEEKPAKKPVIEEKKSGKFWWDK